MQIAEFWIREYDIDGWRLDVPDEITTPGFLARSPQPACAPLSPTPTW